jgi:DNA-binding MarR family transcriptional regulator
VHVVDSSSHVSASAIQAATRLRIVVGRLRRRLREAYDPEELSVSQISVLTRLEKHGPAPISELAAAERVRQQSLGTIVSVLAERGLVERGSDPDDRRRTVVSLSPAGRASIGDKRAAGEEWLVRVLQDRLNEAERQQLISAMELLDRLTD